MASPIPSTGYNVPMSGTVVSLPIPSLSGLSVSQPRLNSAGGTNRITKDISSPYLTVWGPSSTPLTLQAISYKKKIIQTTTAVGGTAPVGLAQTFWVNVYRELDPINYYSKLIQHSNSGHGTTLQNQIYHPANNSDLSKGILWIPKVVVNGAVTSYLWLSDKVVGTAELPAGDSGLGILVHSDSDFAYYWKDDGTYPTVTSGSALDYTPASYLDSNGKSSKVIDPAVVYNKNNSQFRLYYNSNNDVKGPNGKPIVIGGNTGNLATPYWSPFYISYFGTKCPIAIGENDNTRMQSWMSVSAYPSQPELPTEGLAFTFPSGADFAASPTTNVKMIYRLDAIAKGFSKYSGGNYVVDAEAQQVTQGNFPNYTYAWGKWIVLPKVHTTVSTSTVSSYPGAVATTTDYTSISASQARSYFNSGTSSDRLGKSEHWGVFDTQAKATTWATYINTVCDIYNKSRVSSISGQVSISINSSSVWFSMQFNPFGLNGIPDTSWEPFSSGGVNKAPIIIGDDDATTSSSSTSGSSSGAAYDPYGLGPGVRLTVANSVSLLLNNRNKNQLAKNILVSLTKDLGQSWALTKAQLIKSLTAARVQALVDKGVDISVARARVAGDAQIAYLATLAKPVAGGTNSGGGNGNTNPPDKTNAKKTQKITITRGLVGYMPPPSAASTRPQLVQQYRYTETTYSENSKQSVSTQVEIDPLIYEFPFTPREITYSGLGSTWTEIARAGNFPIVDWQSYQLLKISFNFDVVDRSSLPGTTGFGLVDSVDGQLNVLRKMALAPYPVSFLNMDEIMSKELRYPLFTKGRGVEFVINDFTITSVQRTGGTQSQISRASCSMTLQEIPIENANIVFMPPITPCKPKSCPPPTICKKEPCTNNSTFLLTSTLVTGVK